MKIQILICTLVLLACHETLCFDGPAEVKGNCQPGDIPQEDLAMCQTITCNNDNAGAISMSKLVCPTAVCPEDKKTEWTAEDLTKTYPDCCPRLNCVKLVLEHP